MTIPEYKVQEEDLELVEQTLTFSERLKETGAEHFNQTLKTLNARRLLRKEEVISLSDLTVKVSDTLDDEDALLTAINSQATLYNYSSERIVFQLTNTAVQQYLNSANPPLKVGLLKALKLAERDEQPLIGLAPADTYLKYVKYYSLKNRTAKKTLLEGDSMVAITGKDYPSYFATDRLVTAVLEELKTRDLKIKPFKASLTESGLAHFPIALEDLTMGQGETYFTMFISNSEFGTGNLTFGTGHLKVKCWNGLFSISNKFAHSINHRSTSHFNNQLIDFMTPYAPELIDQSTLDFLINYLDSNRDFREFDYAEEVFYQTLSKVAVEYSLSKYNEWIKLVEHVQKIQINLTKAIDKYAQRFNFIRQKDLLHTLIMNDPTIKDTSSLMAIVDGLTRLANQEDLTDQKRLDLQQAASQIIVSSRRINV